MEYITLITLSLIGILGLIFGVIMISEHFRYLKNNK